MMTLPNMYFCKGCDSKTKTKQMNKIKAASRNVTLEQNYLKK